MGIDPAKAVNAGGGGPRGGGNRETKEVNQFLNRMMLLDIETQDRLFDVFQRLYDELIRIDKEDGNYSEGLVTLNTKMQV